MAPICGGLEFFYVKWAKLTTPIVDTYWVWQHRVRQFICQKSHWITSSSGFITHETQNIRSCFNQSRYFQVDSFHNPLWSQWDICLCYPSWSYPNYLHKIVYYDLFLNKQLWPCLAPRDCEYVGPWVTCHTCFHFLIYSSSECNPWTYKYILCSQLHNHIIPCTPFQ